MWRARCTALALAAAALAAPASAFADEAAIMLKEGPGKEIVASQCAACHSLDYIQMNSTFPDRKLWEAEVTKMIKTFGAAIDDAEAKAISDYLVSHYGTGGT